MDFDVEIFKGKSFSDLMKDIYSNSSKKDRQINMMIGLILVGLYEILIIVY
jgi:hypothetical protein